MIYVFVPVTKHSMPYYDYLCENYRKLAAIPGALTFIPVELSGRGSSGHAEGIKQILATPQHQYENMRVIADSDTVMLMKNWDVVANSYVNHSAWKSVIGTSYEDIGGFSSGDSKVQTYKNRATMTWFAYAPGTCDLTQFDTQPMKSSHLKIDSELLSKRFNLPVGYELLRDACWDLPTFLDERNIKDIALKHVKPTKGAIAITTGNDYNEEYHLNGTPFVGHQRGSMTHVFRSKPISRAFYDAVDAYVSKQ